MKDEDNTSHSVSNLEQCMTETVYVCNVNEHSVNPVHLTSISIDGVKVLMETDTGSRLALMTVERFHEYFPNRQISHTSNIKVQSLQGVPIFVKGICYVTVSVKDLVVSLPLVIVVSDHNFVPLLGREWLDVLLPDWRKRLEIEASDIHRISLVKCEELPAEILKLKDKYSVVLSDDKSTTIEGFTAKIILKPESKDCTFFSALYEIPYGLRPSVVQILREGIDQGKYIPVSTSNYASSIWTIPKPNSSKYRVVVDYKRTLNPHLQVDCYPLPKPKDIFVSMSKGKIFAVVDLSEAYLQLKVEEDSQKYLVMNTPLGLLKPTRLMYGIASAPAIFQNVMDQVTQGMEGVKVYLDDVLLSAETKEKLLLLLDELFARMNKYNIRINVEKCQFLKGSVQYLGHEIDGEGIHTLERRLTPILQMPVPQDVTQLRSYLGMINFYRDFLPHMAEVLKPLHRLLGNDTPFQWTDITNQAFLKSKELLLSHDTLMIYDPSLPIIVSTDASAVGVGAVLAHRFYCQKVNK